MQPTPDQADHIAGGWKSCNNNEMGVTDNYPDRGPRVPAERFDVDKSHGRTQRLSHVRQMPS